MLRRIHGWAGQQGISVELTGIDLNPDAVRAAVAATPSGVAVQFVSGDALLEGLRSEADVIVSSLLTHHLEAEEIVRFLRWMEGSARLGWFINDLHRTVLPYRVFAWISRLLLLHPFVRHDGGVSIQRSFLTEDWRRLCAEAGLAAHEVAIRQY